MSEQRIEPSAPGLENDPVQFKVLTEIDMIAHMALVEFERLLPDGMTSAQFGVLNRVIRLGAPETIGELAAAFQVTQPTMSSTVRRLEQKNLIVLKASTSDRRVKYVEPTKESYALRQTIVEAVAPYFGRLQDDDEINWPEVLKALTAIRGLLETMKKPDE